MLHSGTIIDEKYSILRPLGAGGMACVYEAKQLDLDRVIALKIVESPNLADSTLPQRLKREGVALCKLRHKNIMTVYAFGVFNGCPYLIEEYISGTTLQAILDSEQTLSAERAMNIMSQVCEAVEHAHQNSIIHRDLKPANILLCKDTNDDESIKVIDFGLAKILTPDEQKITQTGWSLGTINYMSPEQCRGAAVTEQSDVYAIGAILHHCLAGSPPFHDDNDIIVMAAHASRVPPSVKSANPKKHIPAALQNLIFKALAKNTSERYATVSDMLSDLREIRAGRNIHIEAPFSESGKPQESTQWDSSTLRNMLTSRWVMAGLLAFMVISGIYAWNVHYAQQQESAAVELDTALRSAKSEGMDTTEVVKNYHKWKEQFDRELTTNPKITQANKVRAYCLLITGAARNNEIPDTIRYCHAYLSQPLRALNEDLTQAIGSLIELKNSSSLSENAELREIAEKMVSQELHSPNITDDIYNHMVPLAIAYGNVHDDKSARKWYHAALKRIFQGKHSPYHFMVASTCINGINALEGPAAVRPYATQYIQTYLSITPSERKLLDTNDPQLLSINVHNLTAWFDWIISLDYKPEDQPLIDSVCKRELLYAKTPGRKLTLLLTLARVAMKQKDGAAVETYCAEVEKIAKEHHLEGAATAHAQLLRSTLAFDNKDYAEAIRRQKLALQMAFNENHLGGTSAAARALTLSLEKVGDLAEAEKYARITYEYGAKTLEYVIRTPTRDELTVRARVNGSDSFATDLLKYLAEEHKYTEAKELQNAQADLRKRVEKLYPYTRDLRNDAAQFKIPQSKQTAR